MMSEEKIWKRMKILRKGIEAAASCECWNTCVCYQAELDALDYVLHDTCIVGDDDE